MTESQNPDPAEDKAAWYAYIDVRPDAIPRNEYAAFMAGRESLRAALAALPEESPQ